jgi:hypothetical protein
MVQIACLQFSKNVNGKRKTTKDLDVEKKNTNGKVEYLCIIHHPHPTS